MGRIFLWVRRWDFHGGRRLLGVSAVLFVALSLGEGERESLREPERVRERTRRLRLELEARWRAPD